MTDEFAQLLIDKAAETEAENKRLLESIRVLNAENAKFKDILIKQHKKLEAAGLLETSEVTKSAAEQTFSALMGEGEESGPEAAS
jgi:hypothetical protein